MNIPDHERAADELDRASQIMEANTQESIDRVRKLAEPEQVKDENGEWPHPDCVECEDPIPAKRLEHGFVRCISCQTRLEARRKRGL